MSLYLGKLLTYIIKNIYSLFLIIVYCLEVIVRVFANFKKYRFLLYELTKKGIKLKYRKSYLGILWSLLEPLLTMMVLAYVFGYIFENKDPIWPLYILGGRLIYTAFQQCTKGALTSVRKNSSMIKKVYVPKYMYPISSVLFNFILFAISLIDLVGVMIYYHKYITITWHIVEAIIPIIILLILSVGIGLILATLNVFFRDIEYLWNVATMLIMYMSAIFYKVDRIKDTPVAKLLNRNPIYVLIANFREVVLYGGVSDWASLAYAFVFSMVTLVIGIFVFYRKQDKFILYL
jgi:ABC-2 type transport system permease protein